MQRYKILHRTYYNYTTEVMLGPHTLRLRPREGHELRIETSSLKITPAAKLRWQRDVEDNSVAIATFDTPAKQLVIESEVVIQQYNETPLDFLVADYAVNFPFAYTPEDLALLTPYMGTDQVKPAQVLRDWVASFRQPTEKLQTYALLERIIRRINQSFGYQLREEPGVQSAVDTLTRGTGSCRDFANLLMCTARSLGLAARFVSGYLHAPPSPNDFGATHAWAEIYLPGPGWKGFDPTIGQVVGSEHIPVAVARSPESVPPVEGSYRGPVGSKLDVGVWVTALK